MTEFRSHDRLIKSNGMQVSTTSRLKRLRLSRTPSLLLAQVVAG